MLKIEGKYSTAICYAKVIEDEAVAQIKTMMDTEFAEGSKVRIMPDVHAGRGCTIGTTMTILDKAVPNIVGVDIGCGMLCVNLGKEDLDLKEFEWAFRCFQFAKECREKIIGGDTLDTAAVYNNLGVVAFYMESFLIWN